MSLFRLPLLALLPILLWAGCQPAPPEIDEGCVIDFVMQQAGPAGFPCETSFSSHRETTLPDGSRQIIYEVSCPTARSGNQYHLSQGDGAMVTLTFQVRETDWFLTGASAVPAELDRAFRSFQGRETVWREGCL
ncbi:MAG: hypothetical protein D6722_09810 [Bacteroidetes bacterium]|nr:MAG: hypothetical protein D6722_09810 [Bacteroidota bacterium]